MPNHCINEVVFREPSVEKRAEIVRLACGADGKVDFETLVPIPANVWQGNVGARHEAAFRKQNCAPDWATQSWGTKWNAYDHHPIEVGDDLIVLRFETAWRPPYGWLVALFNTLKISFEHNWLSEGGSRGVCGVFNYQALGSEDKEPWFESEASEEMHRHLHKLLWGVEQFGDEDGADEANGSVSA